MDKLPDEIYDNIISFLYKDREPWVLPFMAEWTYRPRVSGICTISSRWQQAMERRTFKKLTITSDDFDELERIVHGNRRLALLSLDVEILLPRYEHDRCFRYETDEDRAANDKATETHLRRLCEVLAAWDTGSSKLNLGIGFGSPSDMENDDEMSWEHLEEQRYADSFLRIPKMHRTPQVKCVGGLAISSLGARRMELGSCLELTLLFPLAASVLWNCREPGIYDQLRRDIRKRFVDIASGQSSALPPSINTLDITFQAPYYQHHRRLPCLHGGYPSDPTSAVLRRLSTQTRRFIYNGVADSTLFWPGPEEAISKPHWRDIAYLDVQLSLQSPSGQWYFRCNDPSNAYHIPQSDIPLPHDAPSLMPPGYGSEEDTQAALEHAAAMERPAFTSYGAFVGLHDPWFRQYPNDQAINPVLEAFGKALGEMPKLKRAELQFKRPRSYMFLAYAAPGNVGRSYGGLPLVRPSIGLPRLDVHSWDWRMGEKLHGIYGNVGTKLYGQETKITYLPDIFGSD